MELFRKQIRPGMILMWSGSVATIPGGWALCDGTNGTPNLQNRFIVGAGDTYAVDATGGALTHTHTGYTNGHSHEIGSGTDIGSDTDYASDTNSEMDSFTTDAANGLPPYYALAYIMKL